MSDPVLTLRPIEPSDEEFLLRVYGGTREDELALVAWSDDEKQAFIRMQFDAQHAYYQEHYAGASFDVLLADGRPVGRLYVARWEEEIRIVDIALVPEERGKGFGTRILERLLAEAAEAAKRVSIHVEKANRARSLYERLGFEVAADRGVYLLMEVRPERRVEDRQIDRRGFVKLTAGGAAVMLAGSLGFAGTARAARRTRLKIGVLAPTGASYPLMGDSLVRGLRLALRDSPVDARLLVRGVEHGYAGAHAATAALLDEGADLIVAGLSAPVARLVAPLVTEQRTPLLVANAGAHVVRPSERSDYVLHNSLLFWQSSFAAGAWSARAFGHRAVLASSRADAGYDGLYAFQRGFEGGGGSVAASVLTDEAEDGLASFLDTVRDARPDVVYASCCGDAAAELLAAYASSGLRGRVPLVCGGLGVEDFQLRRIGRAAMGIRSFASWTSSRPTPANDAFRRSFGAAARRRPDPFAALGYDTGLLIVAGIRRAARVGLGKRDLVAALAGVRVDSPRGRLRVNGRTNTVTGRVALRGVRRTSEGLRNVELGAARAVPPFPRALAALETSPASGYVNEYLCA